MTATHALAGEIAYAGVDTHKDTNMLGLKDALGRTIGTREFPAGPAGYEALARAIGDASVPVAVEGARSYGAGLAAFLSAGGFRESAPFSLTGPMPPVGGFPLYVPPRSRRG